MSGWSSRSVLLPDLSKNIRMVTGLASGLFSIPDRIPGKKNNSGRKEEKKGLMKEKLKTKKVSMEDVQIGPKLPNGISNNKIEESEEEKKRFDQERNCSANILSNRYNTVEHEVSRKERRKTGVWIESSFLSR